MVVLCVGPAGVPVAALPGTSTVLPGRSVVDAGDVDGDGVHDVAIGVVRLGAGNPADSVEVRSGTNGALLWTVDGATAPGAAGQFLASVGDIDGDGKPDLAVSGVDGAALNGMSVLSGTTGAILWSISGASADFAGPVAPAGDLNLDGVPDVLFGAPLEDAPLIDAGRFDVLSGVPLTTALVVVLPGACGTTPPTLSLTPPVLGLTTTAVVTGALPSTFVNLVIDLAIDSPTTVGTACVFHLDLAHAASWIVMPLLTHSTGGATQSIDVPSIPMLAGSFATLQTFVFDAAAPFGFDLSNGLRATLGY
jgi:hypothetical protein